MNQYWLPLQGVPWGYLVLAARLSRGLSQQPRILHAWSPDRFAQAVNRAGEPRLFARVSSSTASS
jgi:hypothetical protein